jgi:hypothetical protein
MSGYWGLLARAERAHVPLEVCLELTHRCTFRCAHCYIADFAAPDSSRHRGSSRPRRARRAGTLYLAQRRQGLTHPDWVAIARQARSSGSSSSSDQRLPRGRGSHRHALPAKVEISVYSVDDAVMVGSAAVPSAVRARRAVSLRARVVVKTRS